MMVRIAALAVVGALILGGSAAASNTGWTFGSGGPRITITMTEYKFEPSTITVEAGTPVDLILENKGILTHVFMVYPKPKTALKGASEWWEYVLANTYLQDMGEIMAHSRGEFVVSGTRLAEVAVQAGKKVTLTFIPGKKGTFEIGCHLSGHGEASHYTAGMKGTLIVK